MTKKSTKPRSSTAKDSTPPEKPSRRVSARMAETTPPAAKPVQRRQVRATPSKVAAAAPTPTPRVVEWPGVGEQEIVEAVKYGSGPANGGFDEQRFLFPRNYELNRIRLVVRDPEWLFAYWDVNPRAFETIRREMGERAMALSRLTLQVGDPESGASQVILLPYGARSWYVRIEPGRPRYLAELGITLPSGQFRSLARSNVVALPRMGPSSQAAARSIEYRRAWDSSGPIATGVEGEVAALDAPSPWPDPGTSIRPSPEERAGGASDRFAAEMSERAVESRPGEIRGGASDIFRR